MLKKFDKGDIFVNKVKAYPKVSIFTYSGSMYYNNNSSAEDGARLFDFLRNPEFTPPDECAIVAENEYYLKAEDNYYLIIDNCGVTEEVLLTEEGETLITEDNLNLLPE